MRLLLALVVLLAGPAAAQTQTVLFPGQTGSQLLASIRAQYRPASLNGDNDDLYATIDRATLNGQAGVFCVYTGWFVPFDNNPSSDPSQDIFNNGAGLNQEHTWPQAQLNGGGSAISESDLHNLFPTQVGVNSDRGNLPFANITDAQATRWYRGGPPYNQTSVPTTLIDEYSEIRSGLSFEPREDHKGNVARAMFYIEAIYPEETGEAWFTPQLRTLYDWHYADPITAADQGRSTRVAAFQSGKENPFVLDSTLARRAFFPGLLVADAPAPSAAVPTLALAGAHPFRDAARLTLTLPEAAEVRAEAFDALGRRVDVLLDGARGAGVHDLVLAGDALAPGVYVVRVAAGAAVLTRRVVRAE